MAIRPGNGQQTAPEHGTRLAVATLVVAIVGLFLGVVFPPLFLLGVVAIAWGPGTWGGARSGSARRAVV
jgi:hypothetical protein